MPCRSLGRLSKIAGPICALLLLATWAAWGAQPAVKSPLASGVTGSTAQRLREGSSLTDVDGQFRLTGDRATFCPTGSEAKYLALENQNLERVSATVAETPDPLEWIVSGTITEYRGANYLLISRAVLKNKPDSQNRAQRTLSLPARAR